MSLNANVKKMKSAMVKLQNAINMKDKLFLECRPYPDYPDIPEDTHWDWEMETEPGGDWAQERIFPDIEKVIKMVEFKKLRYESLIEIVDEAGWNCGGMIRTDIGEEIDECLEALERKLDAELERALAACKIQSIMRMYKPRKNHLEHLKYMPGGAGFLEARTSFENLNNR
jgi:hypothetical protein